MTPQLLQASGIGPAAVLKAAGVKVKKNIPAVGANFQDHPTMFQTLSPGEPVVSEPEYH